MVCVVNVGSTVRGAHDRLPRMLEALDKAQVPRAKRFMHCDAALSGLILPVISEAEEWHFGFDKGADAIAVSGHKQLGTPVPCGVSRDASTSTRHFFLILVRRSCIGKMLFFGFLHVHMRRLPLNMQVVCAKREHMLRWAAGTPKEADYVNTQVCFFRKRRKEAPTAFFLVPLKI